MEEVTSLETSKLLKEAGAPQDKMRWAVKRWTAGELIDALRGRVGFQLNVWEDRSLDVEARFRDYHIAGSSSVVETLAKVCLESKLWEKKPDEVKPKTSVGRCEFCGCKVGSRRNWTGGRATSYAHHYGSKEACSKIQKLERALKQAGY